MRIPTEHRGWKLDPHKAGFNASMWVCDAVEDGTNRKIMSSFHNTQRGAVLNAISKINAVMPPEDADNAR